MSEHDEQVAVFQWAGYQSHPAYRLMYAVPNAGKRTLRQGAWMKAEGLRAGVPDICMAYPSKGYHGLYIEMKSVGKFPSDDQMEWHENLREAGYRVDVCYDSGAAIDTIEDYLGV